MTKDPLTQKKYEIPLLGLPPLLLVLLLVVEIPSYQ